MKVIIIGATSGIGLGLANRYADAGYQVGVTGRRVEKLKAFQKRHLGKAFIKEMDVCQPEKAIIQFDHLVNQMQGVDLVIINSGIGFINPSLDWQNEKSIIQTNAMGFAALAGAAYHYFSKQSVGHIVSISSINSLRGNPVTPAYGASKAFVSNYMQGLRHKAFKMRKNIQITDIKPGFVNTDIIKGSKVFWCAPTAKACDQIIRAIARKKKIAYISKRWRLVAWGMRLLPDWIYFKLM
ncbi:SDR family NAD(P)-dependent oxidoreductase [Aliikangiella sp. IMCC44653]